MTKEITYKYNVGELVYFKQGGHVYRMVIQSRVVDRIHNEPMYCALKPKCEYAMYIVRERNIICHPSKKGIIEARIMYVVDSFLGLFNIGATHH